MAIRPDPRANEPVMDPQALYLEEVFTDRRVGTIRRLTPVTLEGTTDLTKEILYIGETQVMSNVGALPIAFEIEATNVGDAAAKFGPLAKEAIERTMKELQDMRRQQSSSIVVPQGGMGGMGGLGGGGKIQLP
jgi:hypothetical protein